MKKRKSLTILMLLMLLVFMPSTSMADMGPKPSVNIKVNNLKENQEVYITLLSKEESTGPFSKDKELQSHEDYLEDGFNKFKSIEDKDGYYFLGNLDLLKGNDTYSWSYYPPENFKIALYFPEQNLVLISKPYSRYAFNSNFKLNYKDMDLKDEVYYFDNEISITKVRDINKEIKSFLLRLVLTIIIEYLVALMMFTPTKYQTKLIIKTNIFTQVLLNLAISLILYFYGFLAFAIIFIPCEIFVFIIEGVIYKKRLNQNLPENKKPAMPMLYAFIANLISAGAGYYLVRYFEFFNNML
ncbi:hypothetical protein WKS98_08575 [Lagierella sp. ICN-221743]